VIDDGIACVVCWCAIALGIVLMPPPPLRCDRRWCFRHAVGLSIYCRKHTREILRGRQ
jgi:hypothetical protein